MNNKTKKKTRTKPHSKAGRTAAEPSRRAGKKSSAKSRGATGRRPATASKRAPGRKGAKAARTTKRATPITAVAMLDPRRANNQVQGALEAAFKRCLAHGQFIQGPEVEAFEKQAAAYLGVDHAIGVSSGTDALLVALMALGIGAGDEVICPTYTFFATAGAIWRTGAKPVFCDIKPRCFNIDPEDIARRVTPRTKAIVPVHLFGQAAEMDPILDLARTHGLAVIEDAAQAIGAEYKGRRVGSLGTVGCFSFFPSKNVGGFGDGGLVTTKEGALAARIRALRNHGGMGQYQHTEVGGNFRLDALQAALLAVKLAHADRYTAGRQQNAALYTELFHQAGIGAVDHTGAPCATSCPQGVAYDGVPLILPAACQNRHVFNQYVVRLQSTELRDRLQAALKAKNVGSAIYYPRPMHLQACFAALGYKAGDLPVAEAAAACSLALPIYSELTEDEIRYVVEAVVRFFAAEGVTPIARSAA